MKPKASPLNILNFAVIKFDYNYVPAKDITDFKKVFNEYDLDIDFTINVEQVIHVAIKASVNKGKIILPGYSLSAEVACVFEFNKAIEISEQARNSIEGFSTIYIALNNLRGFISQLTASGPIGKYIFPSIDLNDLINQKKEKLLKQEKAKKASEKTKKVV
jgi:preprotein translocase subunit SecB